MAGTAAPSLVAPYLSSKDVAQYRDDVVARLQLLLKTQEKDFARIIESTKEATQVAKLITDIVQLEGEKVDLSAHATTLAKMDSLRRHALANKTVFTREELANVKDVALQYMKDLSVAFTKESRSLLTYMLELGDDVSKEHQKLTTTLLQADDDRGFGITFTL